MRKFSSYGQIDTEQHYYAPRTALIEYAYTQLVGENPRKGGHYITVWAPRQVGKSTVVLEVSKKLKQAGEFEVALITMEGAKYETDPEVVLRIFLRELRYMLEKDLPSQLSWEEFPELFTRTHFEKPLILILDEFDALHESIINKFASEFRTMYIARASQADKDAHEKAYLLHGLALIGVRSVLGIENVTGSPFNVQRSLHIPNLTFEEVHGMFQWYQQESGQLIEPAVIERLYDETRGHPGLTCWFGELMTETYNEHPDRPLAIQQFDHVLMWATQGLPNNTVLNIISKAKQPAYTTTVLKIFETREKQEFRYDNAELNYLYLNGVLDIETTPENLYVKFPSPFVQKRLFNYFANDLFQEMGQLVEPFTALDEVMTADGLSVLHLLRLYQAYLHKNHEWLFQNAPRRVDLHIREAVYHFNLYIYLHQFLHTKGARVWPEFPTGNGKLDILISYQERLYGLEVKSFADLSEYKKALVQAAAYGKQLALQEITLVFFIEAIDDENRQKYEAKYVDEATGVTVKPVFVETGM
jgi:hypothetical protein